MVMITGGTRVGKSKVAGQLCSPDSKVLLIATAVATDFYMQERIRRSRKQRPINWETYEGFLNLPQKINEVGNNYDYIILESLTSLIDNLMKHYDLSENTTSFRSVEKNVMEDIIQLGNAAKNVNGRFIMITNEIMYMPSCSNNFGTALAEILGRANRYFSGVSNDVYLVVSGIPMKIK